MQLVKGLGSCRLMMFAINNPDFRCALCVLAMHRETPTQRQS